MNTAIRRTGAIVLIAITGLGLSGCGSDSGSSSSTTTTVAADQSGDPTAAIDLTAVKAATDGVAVDQWPEDIQADYQSLLDNIDTASTTTGDDSKSALDQARSVVDTIDGKITDAGDSISSDAQTGWDKIKAEFDKLG